MSHLVAAAAAAQEVARVVLGPGLVVMHLVPPVWLMVQVVVWMMVAVLAAAAAAMLASLQTT
jgi:hypothetical protein